TASISADINGKAKVEEATEVNLSGVKALYQVVMATGKEACRKALPTNAGLKTLFPNPPKINLPKPIAITEPIKAIHKGKLGGSV
ncbi:MAG TPA: hypothetical protein PKD85_20070, partial [Saprospiraceae bacterium]|nr:hypothetical protein [Saprospiraceae bacterium]